MDIPERTPFSQRLAASLAQSQLSQAHLAAAMARRNCKVTPGAVSQWIKGTKRPERDKAILIADLLQVNAEWLLTGDPSKAPVDLEDLRASYRRTCGWAFRRAPEDGGRDFGNANIWSFQPSIRTLVREALQNINDEIIDRADGADVIFRLVRLAGSELHSFLDTLQWNRTAAGMSGLRAHLEACANDQTKLGKLITDGMAALTATGEMVLLVIEDSRTHGLTGPETGAGNFAALVRNNLDTHKRLETAGGSYGLGKAVFWLCSRFSTVLFSSRLSGGSAEGVSEHAGGVHRLMGRADLSWHSLADAEWAGPGWFGRREDGQPGAQSVWDNPAMVHDLYLTRSSDAPGTSIAIVGFHDPSGEVLTDIQQLGDRIASEAARSFWPAIASGRLTVRVVLCDGRDERARMSVEPEHYHSALVDAYLRREAVTSTLSKPGDIVSAPVVLRTPPRKSPDGRLVRVEPHEALLVVRLASEQEARDDVTGQLALFRGSEMVVQYRNIRTQLLAGAPEFHALLACGTAAGDAAADYEAEQFLRAAEPPAHDRWELTTELPARYGRGSAKAIADLLQDTAQAIRDIFQTEPLVPEQGPEAIRDLLRIGGSGSFAATWSDVALTAKPAVAARLPRIEMLTGRVDARGRWEVTADIRTPDSRPWRVAPVLMFDAEGGAVVRVPWESITALEGCRSEGTTLILSGPRRKARFKGISSLTGHPAPASEAAVLVELRDAHPIATDRAVQRLE
jgi:transcriptional regulator with XRE-family HTH domain